MKVSRKITKYLLWLFVFLIVLIAGLYFFIQTDTFNRWALNYTFGKMNKSWETKENHINADSIQGNILKGLKLTNGTITVRGDTLVNFSAMDIKYDIWGLLKHEIRVDHLILNSPRINLIAYKGANDSIVWNYADLFSTSQERDTTGGEFDWGVTLNKLKIEKGYLRVVGLKADTIPVWKLHREKQVVFDFNNSDFSDVELELNAKYFKNNKNITLTNLSFNTNSDFKLKKLAFETDVNIKDTVTNLWNFELVTARSDIKIEKLHMTQFNPFMPLVYENFKEKGFEGKINIEQFNFADLNFFVPSLDSVLDSTVGLWLDASGKYGDMNINSLSLRLPNSAVNLKGRVVNLHDPSNLYFDVTADSLNIYPPDVKDVLPLQSIPDYSSIKFITGNIYYRGTTDNFYSEYNLRTGAGDINGVTTLDISSESYNGYITTKGLNLAAILKNNKLKSSLNLAAKFDGTGFSIKNMSANLVYSANNSAIMGHWLSSSGSVKAVRNNLRMNVKANTSGGSVMVNGNVNIANMNNPVYNLKGKVANLNIAGFTKNSEDQSSLNFTFDVKGHGSNLSNINGNYNFVIDNSQFAGYKISGTPLTVQINNTTGESSVKLSSDMLDFNAAGTFKLDALKNVIAYNVSAASERFKEKLNPDSAKINVISFNRAPLDNVLLRYELVVKDSAGLNDILHPVGMSFNGNLRGNIVNTSNEFNSTLTLDVKDFKYKDTVIVLRNVNTDFQFKNDYNIAQDNNSLSSFTIALNTNAEQLRFDSTKADSVSVKMAMANSLAKLTAKGRMDSVKYGSISGNFDLSNIKISANIDTLYGRYNNYEVKNDNTWVISYLPKESITFEQMRLRSRNAVVNVNGMYSFNQSSDLNLNADNVALSDIFDIMNPPDTSLTEEQRYKYPAKGTANLNINYKGTIEEPELNVELNTSMIKYQDDNIGTLNANIIYKDETIAPEVLFSNANKKGSLKISGKVPYKNPFTGDSALILDGNSANLKLTAKDFQLGFFSKIEPSVGYLRGVLNGEVDASGTVSNPELKGGLKLKYGTYLFGLTGMYYNFNFDMSTANSKLVVNKFSIYNPEDDSKHFDVWGNIDFTGFKLNDIDLTASGDMVILDETVEDNDLGVLGYIYGGSGTPPLRVKGNLSKLDVTGQFIIKDATITSLPLQGRGYNSVPDNFTYIYASGDSLSGIQDSSIAITSKEYNKINPFDKRKYRVIDIDTSAAGVLNLDINVKTEKSIYAVIDFNNLTRDRLFGEINADVNLKTEGRSLNAYGTVEMVGNSYYTFYRDFKTASSKITFNGPIAKPVLDLHAVYKNAKTTQQFGATSSNDVEVVLTVMGDVDNPVVTLGLLENGTEVQGNDAQADAITFLLFGKYKSELSSSERTAVASSIGSNVGSLYASSYLAQALRGILPFVVDAQFKYEQGDMPSTGVEVTSEFGDATVTVGSKQIRSVNYFEFAVDYPLNKVLNLKLPETLLLEISKQQLTNNVSGNTDVHYSTGMKIIYKIKF